MTSDDPFVVIDTHERLDFLLDDSGWISMGDHPGLSCRKGTINSRTFFVAAFGGGGDVTVSAAGLNSLRHLIECAMDEVRPIVIIYDKHLVRDGEDEMSSFLELLALLGHCRGKVASIALVLGNCIGLGAVAASLADIVYCGPSALLSLSDIKVMMPFANPDNRANHADKTDTTKQSDRVDMIFPSEASAILAIRRLANFIPSAETVRWPNLDEISRPELSLARLVGKDREAPIDIARLITEVADDRDWLQFGSDHASGVVTGIMRLDGIIIGVIGNNSKINSGAIDLRGICSLRKHVGLCTRFDIPLISFIDSPGVFSEPGTDTSEILSEIAGLTLDFSDTRLSVVALVVRRAYGATMAAMSPLETFQNILAWPGGRIGLIGETAHSTRMPARMVQPENTRAALITALRAQNGAKN